MTRTYLRGPGRHAAGDRLLASVADALRHRLRSYDLIVRYGGDEFLCVLAGQTAEDAEQRLAQVNRDLAPAGSVTAGVVSLERDESPDALVARADAALYARRRLQRPQATA
ncbi:MAG: GGDEF domain-containing protein [Actinobacteria bacterium]|nr:GGDEF domain-containing protein [Actinomycetota bacterium]